MSPRRRTTTWVLFVVFVVVPLAEIYVLVQVGQVIGAWWTVLLLVLDSMIGASIIRHEGSRAWLALRVALQSGRMPTRELADGALVLIGGTLMLSPGFVTDALGILLLLPVTRPLSRRLLSRLVARRLLAGNARRPGAGSRGPVIRGEVVDEDPREN